MKNVLYFIGLTILSFGLMMGLMFVYLSFSGNRTVKQDSLTYLKGVANTKADRLDSFLGESKSDALFLASSRDVERSFDEELVANTVQVTEMVENVAKKARDEINEYMKSNPTATIDDLVNDPEFQKIALKRVGKTGYTVFHGPDTIINYLHWDPEEQGDDHSGVFEKDPEGQQAQLLKAAQDSMEDVSGFYTKTTSGGDVREKFMYMAMIPTRTADGVRVAAQATVFLDDFGKTLELAKDLDGKLRNFRDTKGYHDMTLIDLDGNIVWSAAKENDLGTNLNQGIYRDTELANLYRKVRDSLSVEVSNPEYYEASQKRSIFVTAPVFDSESEGRKLKGILAFQIDNRKIEDIMRLEIESEGVGEVYAVNDERIHMTSLGEENISVQREDFRHIINSRQIDNCLEGIRFEEKRSDIGLDEFEQYENYARKPVFGVYQYVNEANWCVIAEIGVNEASKRFTLLENKRLAAYVFIGVVALSVIFATIFSRVILTKKAE